MQSGKDRGTVDPDVRDGALNLLRNCAGVEAGDRVLIVGENGGRAFFDPEICDAVAGVAESIGAGVEIVMAPETSGPDEFPSLVTDAMQRVDHTIFFSRIGDQVRFCPLPGDGTKTMCYTHNLGYLGAEFGRTPYRLYQEVFERLMSGIRSARHCRIICPSGTSLEGELAPSTKAGESAEPVAAEFTVKLFPVMIFPPLSCAGLSGRLHLGPWLTSTSTRVYEDSVLALDAPVFARIEKGRIVGFEGDGDLPGRVDRHFRAVAKKIGGDPYAVNSWHTGIYPKTYYLDDPRANIEKWSDLVFGSPRYTHFHVCGSDPGDIATSLYDATISFDDETCWDAGRFSFLERPDIRALLEQYPGSENDFEMRRDTGF